MLPSILQKANQLQGKHTALKQWPYAITFFSPFTVGAVSDSHSAFICL